MDETTNTSVKPDNFDSGYHIQGYRWVRLLQSTFVLSAYPLAKIYIDLDEQNEAVFAAVMMFLGLISQVLALQISSDFLIRFSHKVIDFWQIRLGIVLFTSSIVLYTLHPIIYNLFASVVPTEQQFVKPRFDVLAKLPMPISVTSVELKHLESAIQIHQDSLVKYSSPEGECEILLDPCIRDAKYPVCL